MPFTTVPFIEPRSATTKPWPAGRISAWRRRAARVGDHDVAVGHAPEHDRLLAERDAAAVGQHERSDARALVDLGGDVALTRAELVVGDERDGDGPDEVVALGAGVLPGDLGELTRQGVGEGVEALEVGGCEVDADVVRRDRHPVDPHRALGVERAGDLRRPTSTGSRPLRKALLKVPSTSRSRRCSNPCIPTASVYECIASDSVR